MQKKIRRLILSMILITLTITNISYAQPITIQSSPYGPKVEELKGKENIVKSFEDIKRLRENLIIISISGSSTDEELKAINVSLELYIEEFINVRKDLEENKLLYKDSFPDMFFSEQISFVAESYIISLRQQQNLIIALQTNREEAKNLFYSSYLIPVYYYLTLGDQMISYIETYFVVQ
ncbi:hypothetical protein [Clostridium sp.]|uniref:hypothetical protein n=1 Tax=Clostridium sp. TaxID=1506 RepID=UPI002610DC4B|nr:hypothetical protein [Clostridium sp.]